jgi:hypothetical protein
VAATHFYGSEFFAGEFFFSEGAGTSTNAIGVGGWKHKRCWYQIDGKRLCLTYDELAWYLAQQVIEASKVVPRKDIKRIYKSRPARVVSVSVYDSLIATVKRLEKLAPDHDDDDDEEAVMLLM